MPPEPQRPVALGIMLVDGGYERAHYAFMIAVAAAAIGRRVVLFATNRGCNALCRDWSALDGSAGDAASHAAGVAGLDELREAAADLGVTLLACDSGMRLAGIGPAALLDGAAISGIPAFLADTAGGQLLSL